MQALARATKEVVRQAATRGFAAGAYPERKVAVLGAAGEHWQAEVFSATTAGPCASPRSAPLPWPVGPWDVC